MFGLDNLEGGLIRIGYSDFRTYISRIETVK